MSNTRYASGTVDLGCVHPNHTAERVGLVVAKTIEKLFVGQSQPDRFDGVELTVHLRLDDLTPRLIVTTFKEN